MKKVTVRQLRVFNEVARNGLIEVLPVEDTPIVRTWNLVHVAGKVLSPAAEALRYFILENAEAELAEHDRPLLD